MASIEPVRATGGKALIRNTWLSFSGLICPLLVAIVAIPYIIAKLGADEFGILTLVWMVLSCFSLFDLGLGRAVLKYVAELAGSDESSQIPGIVWTSVWIQVALGCIVALVSVAVIPFAVQKVLTIPIAVANDARDAFLLVAISVPFLLVGNTFRGVLEAAQRFELINYVRIPSGTLTVLLAAVGAGCGLHVTGIMLMILPARIVAAGGYMLLSFRIFPELRNHTGFDRSVVRRLSSFGGWVMVSNVTLPAFAYLERILIGSLLSVGALAFYAAPSDVMGRITVVPTSMALALFPFFSLHGTEGVSTVARISSKSLKYLLLFITPVAVVFVIYAHDILYLWLGPAFAQESTVVFQVLAICLFFEVLCYVPNNSIQALGRPDMKAWLDVIEVLLFAGLDWFLIRKMGINGAAFAKFVVTLVETVGLFWAAKSIRAFNARDLLTGPLPRMLALGAALFVAVFTVKHTVSSLPLNITLAACLLSIYATAAWRLGIDRDEKALIHEMAAQLPIAGRKRMTCPPEPEAAERHADPAAIQEFEKQMEQGVN